MKYLLFILLSFICAAKSYGQLVVEITKEIEPERVYATVLNKSAFYDRDTSWLLALERNITQTIQLAGTVTEGKYIATVKFVVSKDGSIADIACETDPGFGMCDAVVRVLKKSRNWTPFEPHKARVYRRSNQ